jgi:formimidoylglutamate deiminase
MRQIIDAELTWTGEKFERGIRVEVDESGAIGRVGSAGEPTVRLQRQALIPGFSNAHSHAFQRGLRGSGETFPAGSGSFWSWREAMYGLVERLDRETFYTLCLRAFEEMRATGITSVGEFHYLHHSPTALDSQERDYAFDDVVLEAARDAGIRIVLLNVFYKSGGIGVPPSRPQRRFVSDGLKEYWSNIDRLQSRASSTSTIGAVAHSIRAATPDEIEELHRESRQRGIVFHMHVEEQPKEIEDCVAAYGATPMEILLDRLTLDEKFTAVHCTHSTAENLRRFFASGANACITPLTEANLGDGIPDSAPLLDSVSQLSLGTDSNNRISMIEEMRWLEYAQRLKQQSRGVFRTANGANAVSLFNAATRGGARSLGLPGGMIADGNVADFAAIDLDAPSLAGSNESNLLEALIFGSSEEVILATCIAGKWRTHRQKPIL